MKVSSMRRVDSWLGVPLCLAATLLSAPFRWRRKSPDGRPRSVVVIKLSELGALISLESAVSSLRAVVGRENLYFLTFAEAKGLLEILDYLPRENILTLRTDSFPHFTADAIAAVLRLRRLGVECSLDLDFFARATALFAWLGGCRQRVGCHAYFGEGPYRGQLLTHRVRFNPHIHISRMFEVLAKAVESPPGDLQRLEFASAAPLPPRRRFQPAAQDSANVERLLAQAGVRAGDLVVLLNSNNGDLGGVPLRKWADERYVELAKLILAEIPKAVILLTGSELEAAAVEKLEAVVGSPRCRSAAGKTTLRELLTLYGRSAVLVTNDSGPAHFATLTEIDIVVLFGPETPLLWRPLGDKVHVVYRGLACSPCFSAFNGRQSSCRRNVCMDIPPSQVLESVRHGLMVQSPS